MNYQLKIKKAAQRAGLSARIVLERPDLIALSFGKRLNTYIFDTLERYLDEPEPKLPTLLEDALGYDADKSAGHYRALYMLYQKKHLGQQFENMEQATRIYELTHENIQAHELASDAVKIATNAVGPRVRRN